MAKAIYAGSFDPITNGHLWIIDRGAAIFEKLVVAVGDNPEKTYTFSLDERVQLLQESLAHYDNIEIGHFSGQFLVSYAAEIGANYIVRGIRNAQDFEFEKTIRYINSDVSAGVDTIFLIPPRDCAEVSSSLVKGFVGTAGWEQIVTKYVPPMVLTALVKKNKDKHAKHQ